MRRLFYSFLALVLFALGIAYLIARTGLVTIPVVSAVAYQQPTADHVVTASTSVTDELQAQLIAALQTKLNSGTLSDANASLSFTEGSLTTSLREAIKQGAQTVFNADASQVALLADGSVEFFLPLVQNGGVSNILLTVTPSVTDGKIVFAVTRFRVGQLAFPSFMQFLVQWPVDKLVAQLNDFVEKYVALSSIKIEQGIVHVDGTMTLDLKTLLK